MYIHMYKPIKRDGCRSTEVMSGTYIYQKSSPEPSRIYPRSLIYFASRGEPLQNIL